MNKANRTNQGDINELYRYPIFLDVEEPLVGVSEDVQCHPECGGYGIHLFE